MPILTTHVTFENTLVQDTEKGGFICWTCFQTPNNVHLLSLSTTIKVKQTALLVIDVVGSVRDKVRRG